MLTQTSRPRLDRFIGLAALSAVLFVPALGAAASPAVPPALQPALYTAMAKDAGPAYAIGRDDCAMLKAQHLTACFGKGGARFSGTEAAPVSLHLTAYGRGQALTSVKLAVPTIQGNRASYAHGNVTEWWRVLPVGFEQGFTVAERPAGKGDLTLALAANRKAATQGDNLAFGKLDYGRLVVTDAKGRVMPSKLSHDGNSILIAVDDNHAAYPLAVDPLVWIEQQVFASDGVADDQFGFAVALDGSTAIIGAPFATVGGYPDEGAAYVFDVSGGTWTQTAKLTASDGTAGIVFGGSVALNGTTALIGAPLALVGNNTEQGSAYVFSDSGGSWSQTAKLTASDGAAYDEFGTSVALSGTTALVGEPFATVGANGEQGAAYAFDDSGGSWSQTAKLIASDGATSDLFGHSVALSGTTALAGAPGAAVGGVYQQGAVYVFDESGGNWTESQKLTANDGAIDDVFGSAVGLSGSMGVIGAPGATVGGESQRGAAYVFDDTGGTWIQAAKLTASDGLAFDEFGTAVALSGDMALVGSPYTTVGGNSQQGAAYLFADSSGAWNQTNELTASDGAAADFFGYSVALSGITAFVGAPEAAVGGNQQQGEAYAYTATCPQGYGEHDGTLNAGGLYGTTPYQAPAGIENGILGGPAGFQLYLQYSNGGSPHSYRILGNEIHKLGPAGTYRWGVKAGNTGGNYVLCVLHP